MTVKAKRSGLTIVEMLVVVGIISLLVGMLLPAVNKVKKMAREAKQRVQFTAIEIGLATFKNDYGDFPPSDHYTRLADTGATQDSSGAQKLAEALLGLDLLGFHPDSGFRVDGMNQWDYSDGTTTHAPGTYWLYDRTISRELEKRRDRYIDIDTANAVQLGQLFGLSGQWTAAASTPVLGDVFGKGGDVLVDGKRKKAGLPILYYRADTSGKASRDIYDYEDNYLLLTDLKEPTDVARKGTAPVQSRLSDGVAIQMWNPLADIADEFYIRIRDGRATTVTANSTFEVPHKPDSYILISAGADGRYGTNDDICNFQK
jgi:type II secretory pathway pseudopilin PulG